MSTTFLGAYTMIAAYLGRVFGLPVLDDQAIQGFVMVIGFLVTCFGRWRAGNVNWFGKKV